MRTAIRAPLVAALALAALCGGAATAQATPFATAMTWGKPQVSGGLRLGTENLNLGFGARGGYTFPQGAYVGGVFDYFLGESGFHFFDLGIEGGYDFAITPVMMVRPFAGLGLGWSRGCVGDICNSDSDTFIELGGLVDYFMDKLYIGGELRILSANDTAIVLGGHVGITF
jgi:hypothetical protein